MASKQIYQLNTKPTPIVGTDQFALDDAANSTWKTTADGLAVFFQGALSFLESVQGTANQINVDATDPKNVILSTPQDIDETATPIFESETLKSDSLLTTPTQRFFQSQVPPSFQLLSTTKTDGLDSLSFENSYHEEKIYSWDATSGNLSTRIDTFAFAGNLKRLITRFSGEDVTLGAGGLYTLNCPTTFSSHNVDGIANLGAFSGAFTSQITVGFDATMPLQVATLQQLQAAVVGIYKLQGSYNPNITNLFPVAADTTNPVSASVKSGMLWVASASGNASGVPIDAGDTLIALIDSPGQAATNWSVIQNNIGYTPLSNILPAGQIFVGNTSNIAVGQTLSDDVTVTPAGSITINKIQSAQSVVNSDMFISFFASSLDSRQALFINTDLAYNPSLQLFKAVKGLFSDTTFASTAFTGAVVIGSGGVNSVGIGGGSISATGNITAGGAVSVGSGGQLVLNGRTDKRPLVMNGSSAATSNLVTDIDWASPVINSQQNAFNAYMNATVSDVTGDGTQYVILYDAAPVNKGTPATLDTATGVITVQKTGNYLPAGYLQLAGLTNQHTTIRVFLLINGAARRFDVLDGSSQDRDSNNQWGKPIIAGSIFLTAGDIITVNVIVSNGTKVVDLFGAPESGTRNTFSMNLIN